MNSKADDVFDPTPPVVPTGWDLLPFDDAVEVVSDGGKRVKQRAYLSTGKLPVIDQGQDSIGGYTDDDEMAFEGDLPVILFGDHTRSIKYVDRPFAVGAEGVKVLKPSSGFDPKYLFYFLRSLRIPSRGYSRHFQFLRKFHFPRAPAGEQKRIVAEIEKQFSRLDEAVANLNRVKANLKRYKAAVLKAAVEGRLVETEADLARREGRAYETGETLVKRVREFSRGARKRNHKEAAEPDRESLPPLTEGWVWATFSSIAKRVTVGHVGPMKDEYVPTGIPFLRSQNVRPNRFDPEGLKFISADFHSRLAKSRLRPGDVVVVRSGTVGVSCVVPEHLGEANCADLVIIQEPQAVLPAFGAYYVNSVVETRVAAAKVGIALTHFNTQSVASLPVPVPPLAEQHRILSEIERRLSLAENVEREAQSGLLRAEQTRQAILHSAFAGRFIERPRHFAPCVSATSRARRS